MLRSEAEGWAPLYRRIFGSDVWLGQVATTKVVLVWIIGHIRHTGTIETPAGAVDATLDDIGRECNTTRNTTRNALSALSAVGFIEVSRSRAGLRITVTDWRQWLACDQDSTRHLTHRAPAVSNESNARSREAQPLTLRSSTVAPPIITEEVEEGSVASQQRESAAGQILPASKLDGYKESIAVFHDRYVAAYGGRPTWRAAEGSQMKRLLLAHGAVEVQRRIAVLFTSPPRWLRPPYTFMTFVRNFDSLVVAANQGPTSRRGGLTPAEILQRAASRTT